VTVTNNLAYFNIESVTVVKSFTAEVPGAPFTKPFTSMCMGRAIPFGGMQSTRFHFSDRRVLLVVPGGSDVDRQRPVEERRSHRPLGRREELGRCQLQPGAIVIKLF
jgi:hypothetical protein